MLLEAFLVLVINALAQGMRRGPHHPSGQSPVDQHHHHYKPSGSSSMMGDSQLLHDAKSKNIATADLFGEISDSSSDEVRKPKTVNKPSKRSAAAAAAPSSSSSSSAVKKSKLKINPANIVKPTAQDLFGSDSEEEVAETDNKVPNLNEVMHCKQCDIELPKYRYRFHVRTNIHKSNCLLRSDYENVNIVATAFKNRIMTYRLNASQEVEYLTAEAFLQDNKRVVHKLINASLQKNYCIKMNCELFAYFMLCKTNEKQLKSFNTKYEIIYQSTSFNELYRNIIEKLSEKLTEFSQCESGWSFLTISHLEININKYSPLRGGTYLELPPKIKNTKSCINVKNNDNNCFVWSIVAGMFPAKNNVCRTSSYPHYTTVLKTEGLSMPPSNKDILMFEKINSNISVNVYGLDNKYTVNGPLYKTMCKKPNHFNLLYFEKNGLAHYCLIKNLARLVRRQASLHKDKIFLCDTCLQFFSSECKLNSHDCSNVLTVLPERNSYLKFKHYERQQKINFIIYADFECLLMNCNEMKTENTETNKIHEPSCFAYYICCSHDKALNRLVSYRGSDCVQVFIESLITEVNNIHTVLSNKKCMSLLTEEQEIEFCFAKTCYICNKALSNDKVRDHDHITGKYRGPAHSHCNLMHRVCPFVPVVFHNLSGYDSHIFMTELAKYEGEIKVIPKTKEKYLSFTKFIKTNKCSQAIQIKFIDSYQFLSTNLDSLSKNLSDEDFVHLKSEFDDEFKGNLLRQKGIYPYEYMDSWSKYDETQIPPKEKFYSSLKLRHISDEEYEHAKTVWQYFDIHSLGEYTDLYVKCDVLLLCDIFENFRTLCLKYYHLDPAYYITSPGLSWDAMLMYTGVELELIHDLEIYQFLELGIRGGLVQCSMRHAKANNKYVPFFDDSKPSNYLIYLDCNNLYGHAMTRKIPISGFKFMTKEEMKSFDVMSISDDAYYGYILEVDLGYPDHLHDLHSDLPFAPQKMIPPGGKTPKLISNLYEKFNYVIHYIHLKECLKNGLILVKIHRVLIFKQDNFLKSYIDLNTNLRQKSSSAFQKDFFKLLNNAIFGKTIENKRKQVDVKLITCWNDSANRTNKHVGAEKLITKPNLKSISIFNENFVAIQLNHEKIVLDRPIYIGFTVLEYAKQHLYRFHYDFIQKKYGDKIKLCYTDTDSLLYFVQTDDFYSDMKNDIAIYDTSNFAKDNPYMMPHANAKVPGLFKDELGGDVITEFIGLRAKLYCIKSIKTKLIKAKGVSKSVTSRLKLSQYARTLYNNEDLSCKMNLIKSIKHKLYSQQLNKVVLNRDDDKRHILLNQIETLPWGHYSLKHQTV